MVEDAHIHCRILGKHFPSGKKVEERINIKTAKIEWVIGRIVFLKCYVKH